MKRSQLYQLLMGNTASLHSFLLFSPNKPFRGQDSGIQALQCFLTSSLLFLAPQTHPYFRVILSPNQIIAAASKSVFPLPAFLISKTVIYESRKLFLSQSYDDYPIPSLKPLVHPQNLQCRSLWSSDAHPSPP